MRKIRLPIDTKSLYFNIKNDNLSGHTPTVASPLKKKFNDEKLEDILLIREKQIDISNKENLVSLLIMHSKTKVLIKNVFVFDKLTVNGKKLRNNCCLGCYIKEEIDETKVQFGRLKLHYPPKFIYEDDDVNINNKEIYKEISEILGGYAFIIRAFEYDCDTKVLNFDALIVGENKIPYSKVFINEKGTGNKFNFIFNENADDYDREIILLREKYGEDVNPYNYLDYFRQIKENCISLIENRLKTKIEMISFQFPYSIFDFCFEENGVKKYGILRITCTKNTYFNLSIIQQLFIMKNPDDVKIYLVKNAIDTPELTIIDFDKMSSMAMIINSVKYEED